MKKSFCVLALVVAFAVVAAADTIPTANTGINVLGNKDLSYTVNGAPAYLVTPPLGWGWVSNGGGSNWIAPSADTVSAGSPVGNYTYATTFDLGDFDPNSASLAGQVAVDDGLYAIYLNGNELFFGDSHNDYNTLRDYSFTSGFVAGVNTLQIVAYNAPYPYTNPTGIDNRYTVEAFHTPEPGSMLLFGTGLVSLAGVLRRKLGR
jgi:hypothetical protein